MRAVIVAVNLLAASAVFGAAWTHRAPVTVTYQGEQPVSDAVVPVLLDTDLLGDPYGGMHPEGADLRVANAANTAFPFWTEILDTRGLSTVWVKVGELQDGDTSFYLYWGNAEAEDASDPRGTFLFFDDFKNGINTEIWHATANEAQWQVVDELDWIAEWVIGPWASEGFAPQGATWYNGNVLISGHFSNARATVYECGAADGQVIRSFDMPAEATHTSGLCWDGTSLWACDYNADKVYKLALEESLVSGAAVVEGSFASTLVGTGAVCMGTFQGEPRLMLSDYTNSALTLVIDHVGALQDGTAEGHVLGSYTNPGQSQALVFVDGFLYEADDKITQLVKLDVEDAVAGGSYLNGLVASYTLPSANTQGVAWDGTRLWAIEGTSGSMMVGELRTLLKGTSDATGHTHMLRMENPVPGIPIVADALVRHSNYGGVNPAGGVATSVNADASNYYLAETSGANFVLNRFDSWSAYAAVNSAPNSVGYGHWYRLSIGHDGETGALEALIRANEGRELNRLSGTDVTYKTSGLGLRLWRSWTFFSEFRLRPWVTPAPTVVLGAVEQGSWTLTAGVQLKRGDSNTDASLNIADAVRTLGYLFGGAGEPPCVKAADANDDGVVNIADAVKVLGHLFGGTGPLPDPFGACGLDPTDDGLTCVSFPPCGG